MKADRISTAMVASTVLISAYLYVDVGTAIFFPMFLPIAGIALKHYLLGTEKPIDDFSPQGGGEAVWVVLGVIAIGLGGVLGQNLAIIEGLSMMSASLYVTLVAIGEESFFRDFLYSWFRQLVSIPSFAMLGSALIFMVYHSWRYASSPSSMFYVFIAGVVLAYVCYATNRLWPAIAIHIINNLLSVR